VLGAPTIMLGASSSTLNFITKMQRGPKSKKSTTRREKNSMTQLANNATNLIREA